MEVEDGWPLWIGRRFKTTRTIRATRQGGKPLDFSTDKIELRLKAVCHVCNQGWMSDLETRAEPILTPMINAVPTTLDRASQQLVATWAVKTAMVLEHTLSHDVYWSGDERAEFARPPHAIPGETVVWISAYQGSQLALFRGGLGSVGSILSREPLADSTRATIVIGSLVLQVESNRYLKTTGRVAVVWPPAHSTKAEWIWPIQHEQVPWPTAEALTDSQLAEFAGVQAGEGSGAPLTSTDKKD